MSSPTDDQPTPGPDPHGAPHSGSSPFGGPSAAGPPATGHPESAFPEDPEVVGEGVPAAPLVEDVSDGSDAVDALDVLAATERERDEYLDSLRRLQADFENFKKRVGRQQVEAQERAGEDLAVKLLPVLDTIDLARQHGEGEAIAPLASSLVDVLAKAGLERIDPVGAAFDPNEHEAVSHEPSDEEADGEPVVSGLMRAGYRWKGRLVRAAMVTVKG